MKKINFDIVFKIIVLLFLTIILWNQINSSTQTNTDNNSNQNGRYKEVKIKTYGYGGREEEGVRILDTQTGLYVE